MEIPTTRFGRLTVDENEIITLPRGLFGFPASHRFVLLDHAPGGCFKWLQSVDDPGLAFVVVNPCLFFPDYEIELDDERARRLGIARPEEAQILTTVTLRSAPREITANLLGPLVVGTHTLRAEQMVLDAERYSTRHPLPLARPATRERVLQNVA